MRKELLKLVDEWLVAEDETIAATKKIAGQTKNESIRLWMDIVRTDSVKHKRMLEFIRDSFTKAAPAISYDEIGAISEALNAHVALEQKTVDLGHKLAAGVRLPVQKQLFEYLLEDEQKHVRMLAALAAFKTFASQNT